MSEPLDWGPANDLTAPWNPELRDPLDPGEVVVWAGRPRSIGRLVRQSLPKALLGLGVVAFVLAWMAMVVRGENNNWDKGKPVGPFAPHNVAIAVLAGCWLMPPGVYLLTWPLRTWRKAGRTIYALTDRRVLIGEPRWSGRLKMWSCPPQNLMLMRCRERADGSGDLVFTNRKTWAGWTQAAGFEIERVRDVEHLVRTTLIHEKPSPVVEESRDRILAEEPGKTYRIPVMFRFPQFIMLAIGSIAAFCVVGNLVVALAIVLIVPHRVLHEFQLQVGKIGHLGVAVYLLGALGTLIMGGVMIWFSFRLALTTPTVIAIGDEGEVEFRSWLRTVRVRATTIQSIETGGWIDPSQTQVLVRHKDGRIRFFNQFLKFNDFLKAIKALNPAVEIKGF